jgi:hypothetical protein
MPTKKFDRKFPLHRFYQCEKLGSFSEKILSRLKLQDVLRGWEIMSNLWGSNLLIDFFIFCYLLSLRPSSIHLNKLGEKMIINKFSTVSFLLSPPPTPPRVFVNFRGDDSLSVAVSVQFEGLKIICAEGRNIFWLYDERKTRKMLFGIIVPFKTMRTLGARW